MVDSAIAATITIEVAELNPPRKDRIASPSAPVHQRQRQHEEIGIGALGHDVEPDGGDRHHEEAHQHQIGGKGPAAVRRWSSSSFSTTIT